MNDSIIADNTKYIHCNVSKCFYLRDDNLIPLTEHNNYDDLYLEIKTDSSDDSRSAISFDNNDDNINPHVENNNVENIINNDTNHNIINVLPNDNMDIDIDV